MLDNVVEPEYVPPLLDVNILEATRVPRPDTITEFPVEKNV